jgi:SAM-dependent methyltransferase
VGRQFDSTQYDELFSKGGAENVYGVAYRHSAYYPLYRQVHRLVTQRRIESVLEVGCGTGAFARLLLERSAGVQYHGFDFSRVAVEKARARTGHAEWFEVGDARDAARYSGNFDAIVCTEVLEHLEADLEVVRQWPEGTFCVVSVPNYDADDHVRHFNSEDDVRSRYGALIEIEHVKRVKKPFLSDISVSNYWRALRWNRYRPSRWLAIAGLSPFATGGWFVFSGVRRITSADGQP